MTRVFAVACLVAVLTGCGGGSGALTGKVTYKKIPLNQGEVLAFNEQGQYASGRIEADGSYRIDNCPGGKVKLAVTSPDPQALAAAAQTPDDPARRRRTGGTPPTVNTGTPP